MDKFSSPVLEGNSLDLQIEALLRRLQIDGTLDGMHFLIHAIHTAVIDPTTPGRITKSIYIDTATHFSIDHRCVEHSMRTAIKISWERGGRQELDRIAGYHLVKRPTNSQFIDIVSAYIRHN